MLRRFSANFAVFSIFLDALLVALALIAAVAWRPLFNGLPGVQILIEVPQPPGWLYVVFALVWVGALMLLSLYDGRKNLRAVDEFASLFWGSALAAVCMAGVLYLGYRDLSRLLFALFIALGFLWMAGWRILARLAFRSPQWSAVQTRRVLILGAGVVGRRVEEKMRGQHGIDLIGFLDDDPRKQAEQPDVLGGIEPLREVIAARRVDDVVVALPLSAHQRLNRVASELHDLPVRVWVIPDYFSLALHRASVEDFAGIPMLDLRAPALSEYQRMVKRAFDLTLVLLTLPFTLPVIAVLALLIKLDDGGPVFYTAPRAGENGKLFRMIKFRTMVVGADRLSAQLWQTDEQGKVLNHKRRDDPRITRVGRFLRRSSLDELPQIINVVRNEMSLVGPRPELPELVAQYEAWQRKRFAVPQGITGWWQVNGRSDKPMHLNTQDDIYYVQHYSIWLDLQILVKTVTSVLRGKGAF